MLRQKAEQSTPDLVRPPYLYGVPIQPSMAERSLGFRFSGRLISHLRLYFAEELMVSDSSLGGVLIVGAGLLLVFFRIFFVVFFRFFLLSFLVGVSFTAEALSNSQLLS